MLRMVDKNVTWPIEVNSTDATNIVIRIMWHEIECEAIGTVIFLFITTI